MCGIAGWFSQAPQQPEGPSRLAAMMHAVSHRGPDGRGEWFDRNVALGHVRLAIIDPAGGRQPMHSGQLSISFNGEIYNYREIKARLAASGFRFSSDSDTEVILALYQSGGWPAFSELRGMYAFALWDGIRNRGYLVRDPLGIKPLFVAEAGDDLLFASEAKGILAHGAVAPALDEGALHLLMNFRYLPGDRTMFRGIRQLPAGTVIEWHPGRIHTHPLPQKVWPELSPMDAIRDSVKAHFTADVEVGAYLSGGIDSALIAVLGRGSGLEHTFTLAVGDDPQEATNAVETAQLLGLANVQGDVQADVAEQLPRLVRHLEVPKINAYQTANLATLARTQVKVALSGLGGDELFYGYNAHRLLHQAATVAKWLPQRAAHALGQSTADLLRSFSRLPWTEVERAARMLAAQGQWPRVYGLLRNVWDGGTIRGMLYGPRMLGAELPDAFEEIETAWPAYADPVEAMAHYEWREKMVNDLLWQEDRVSMAEGLEVRVPFVDLQLAQAIGQRPRRELMPHGRPKGYMRTLVGELLPRRIVERPKSGFQVDAAHFFHSHLLSLARECLSPGQVGRGGLFNPDFVRSVMAAPPRKTYRWHYFMLYLMLMTELWLKEFTSA